MQPRFPADHHFYERRPRRAGPAPRADELATLTNRALTYFARQHLPAFDGSDPRG